MPLPSRAPGPAGGGVPGEVVVVDCGEVGVVLTLAGIAPLLSGRPVAVGPPVATWTRASAPAKQALGAPARPTSKTQSASRSLLVTPSALQSRSATAAVVGVSDATVSALPGKARSVKLAVLVPFG